MDWSPPGSSVHGIFQARILKSVAISYCRGFSQPRDQTHISCIFCIGRQILYYCATCEAPYCYWAAVIIIFLGRVLDRLSGYEDSVDFEIRINLHWLVENLAHPLGLHILQNTKYYLLHVASQVKLVVKNPLASAGDVRDVGSIPGLGRSLGGRAWQPTPMFLPGESGGQRSLVGYSP